MPRKEQGWITFQSSPEERKILEQHSKQSQRSKTEILRELIRSLNHQESTSPQPPLPQQRREGGIASPSELKSIKLSARNIIRGTVKKLVMGGVNTQVTLEIVPGVEIVSIITTEAAKQLNLAEGKQAYAVIKSSNVMIAE
jgi:molybdopterin-binding protein